MADLTLLQNQGLEAIAKAEAKFEAALAQAKTLIRQAVDQYAGGQVSEARDSIADAGDILHEWLDAGDVIAPLEEAMWEGDDDAWQAHSRTRVGRRS